MPLSAGTRLGPYEVLSVIGAGGMGEVYRAKDTRLDRIVAIKILPTHLSENPDLKERFEREARTISSLSHPHICALHDIGNQNGIDYLVMEFLEGENLAERLNKGPLPMEQVLKYGTQIAEALDKAHRQGVVHRDLKPGNIMLTRSGVKLLDFGLAKSELPIQIAGTSAAPTKQLTAEGTILGTLQYMAPEQLEGKSADARTDLFAMGVVLYEMATARKAFIGNSQASLIAAILSSEPPPLSAIQPLAPPAFERVVKTCLAKDPEDRWQSAHDVASELRWIQESSSQQGIAALPVKKRKRREMWLWLAIAVLSAVSFSLLAYLFYRPAQTSALLRFNIPAPEKSRIRDELSFAPDGHALAFVAIGADGSRALWVRSMTSGNTVLLPDTQNASFPFWSPDGRYVAFFADGKLKRLDPSSGTSETICDAGDPRGGSWSKEGVILFTPSSTDGLYSVPVAGGEIRQVTSLDPKRGDGTHRWPFFLPDGRHFLFYDGTDDAEVAGIYLGSLDSHNITFLTRSDVSGVYDPAGYLLFTRQSRIMAQKFDAKALKLLGEPISIADRVAPGTVSQIPTMTVSNTDLLAFSQGEGNTELHWFDRTGKDLGDTTKAGDFQEPAFSPDEKHVAFDRDKDIWILDFSTGVYSRFTFSPANENCPLWSPDGRNIVFASGKEGTFNLYIKPFSGVTEEEVLFHSANPKYPDDWTKDGKYILYEEADPKTKFDLWVLPMFGDRKPVRYLQTQFNEAHSQFSPDGHWVAYVSDESGRSEVYVRTFPAAKGGKWQVSTDGGDEPSWSANGKELFFLSLDRKVMSVTVNSSGDSFASSTPTALFQTSILSYGLTGNRNHYLPFSSGDKFLVDVPSGVISAAPITVVVNWKTALQK